MRSSIFAESAPSRPKPSGKRAKTASPYIKSTLANPTSPLLANKRVSWNLDDLISSYHESGQLPPMLSPTLPAMDRHGEVDTDDRRLATDPPEQSIVEKNEAAHQKDAPHQKETHNQKEGNNQTKPNQSKGNNQSEPIHSDTSSQNDFQGRSSIRLSSGDKFVKEKSPFMRLDLDDDVPLLRLLMLSPTLPTIFDNIKRKEVKKKSEPKKKKNYVRFVNKLDAERPRFLLRINFDSIDKYAAEVKRWSEGAEKKEKKEKKDKVLEKKENGEKKTVGVEKKSHKRADLESITKEHELALSSLEEQKRQLVEKERLLEERERELQKHREEADRLVERAKKDREEAKRERRMALLEKEVMPLSPEPKSLPEKLLNDKFPKLANPNSTLSSTASTPSMASTSSIPSAPSTSISAPSTSISTSSSSFPTAPSTSIPTAPGTSSLPSSLPRNPSSGNIPVALSSYPPNPNPNNPSLPQIPQVSARTDETNKILQQKKNQWLQIARSTKEKAQATHSRLLSHIINVDALLLKIIANDYDERAKIVVGVLPSERLWKNVVVEVSDLIASLHDYVAGIKEKNLIDFSKILLCILLQTRALVYKRINGILSMVIELYKKKKSESLYGKIIELQQLYIDNDQLIIKDFMNCKPDYLLAIIPQKFPQTTYKCSHNLKTVQLQYDLSNYQGSLKPRPKSFFLPFGVYSNLNEAVSLLYYVVSEFIDIFNKYNPNDAMRYLMQSGGQ